MSRPMSLPMSLPSLLRQGVRHVTWYSRMYVALHLDGVDVCEVCVIFVGRWVQRTRSCTHRIPFFFWSNPRNYWQTTANIDTTLE